MARIIVIGAGVAGLAAAARMSSNANDVTLVERGSSPGGSLIWATPDVLTLPAVLRDLFVKTGGRKESAGGRLEDVVDLRPTDPARTYRFPDGSSLDLPNAARGASKDAFDAAFGAGAGDAWLRVVDHGNRAWSAIRPTLVEVPDAGRRELWRLLQSSAARRALAPRRTLRQLGEAAGVRDPRMMRILDEYARAAGAEPDKAPAVLAIRPYIEQTFGTWRVVGGLPALATALYERCLKRGVDFRFDREVTRIAAGSVTLADGERMPADVIVAAVDVGVLARLTGSKAPKPTEYSTSMLSVRMLSSGPAAATVAGSAYETVFFGSGSGSGSGGGGGGRGGGGGWDGGWDGDGYRNDGGDGGSGEPTIRVHVAPEKPGEWVVHADAATDAGRVRNITAARMGVAEESLTITDVFTPADRERLTGTPGGSLHGPAVRSLSSAVLRSPTVQPTKGLLHVGPSSRPGPGIAFAALSAWNAAEVLKPTRI